MDQFGSDQDMFCFFSSELQHFGTKPQVWVSVQKSLRIVHYLYQPCQSQDRNCQKLRNSKFQQVHLSCLLAQKQVRDLALGHSQRLPRCFGYGLCAWRRPFVSKGLSQSGPPPYTETDILRTASDGTDGKMETKAFQLQKMFPSASP